MTILQCSISYFHQFVVNSGFPERGRRPPHRGCQGPTMQLCRKLICKNKTIWMLRGTGGTPWICQWVPNIIVMIVMMCHQVCNDNQSTLICVFLYPFHIARFRGCSRCMPPRVQILSFWHTNLTKSSCTRNWHTPCQVAASTLQEILDLPLELPYNFLSGQIFKGDCFFFVFCFLFFFL